MFIDRTERTSLSSVRSAIYSAAHKWAGDTSRVAIYKHFVPTALGEARAATQSRKASASCGRPLSALRSQTEVCATYLDRRLMTRANILAVQGEWLSI